MSNEPNVTELRRRAAELNIDGRSNMDKDALVDAIAKAEAPAAAPAETPAETPEASSSTSTSSSSSPPAETPVEETPLEGDVESRAVGRHVDVTRPPAGGFVRVGGRVELDADAPRAPQRGIYRTRDNRRRVVGAGQVIPDGWTLLEEASLAERTAAAEDASPAVATEDKAERGPRGR